MNHPSRRFLIARIVPLRISSLAPHSERFILLGSPTERFIPDTPFQSRILGLDYIFHTEEVLWNAHNLTHPFPPRKLLVAWGYLVPWLISSLTSAVSIKRFYQVCFVDW